MKFFAEGTKSFWFNGLAALLAFMPLPFGANRPWAADSFGLISAVLLAMLGLDLVLGKAKIPEGMPKKRLGFAAAMMSFVFLWAFLQTQSWMPQSWHHPVWGYVKNFPESFEGAISVDMDGYNESMLRILGYIACFLLAFFGGRDAKDAKKLLKVLSLSAVVYAVYGLVVQSSGMNKILWYDRWAYENSVTSTFVNKNSFATYASLGLLCCLASLWMYIKKKPEKDETKQSAGAFALEKFGTRDVFYVLACLAVFCALALSGSRAGMFSGLAGCAAMLGSLALNRRWKWKTWLPLLVVCASVAASVLTLGDTVTLDRFEQKRVEVDSTTRLNAYKIALTAIADNPWRGFGLGAFDAAFKMYRDSTVRAWFHHAHNDYLELAVELGVPFALMYLFAVMAAISCCVQGAAKRKRDEVFPILAVAASATVGLHSFVDFSMQIPAVAAIYSGILGLGVAQSWSTRR